MNDRHPAPALILCSLLVALTALSAALGLAPFLTSLLTDLGASAPTLQGTVVALTMALAALCAAWLKLHRRAIAVALVLMSFALVGGRYVAGTELLEKAAHHEHQESLRRRQRSIREAQAARDLALERADRLTAEGTRRLIPALRRDGREARDKALAEYSAAMALVPAVAPAMRAELATRDLVRILALALLELAVALLVELLALAAGTQLGRATERREAEAVVEAPEVVAVEEEAEPTKAERRRQAALKGWETRRRRAAEKASNVVTLKTSASA
jgi:hypothetical protein